MTIRSNAAAAILRRHLNALKISTGALAIAVSAAWMVPAMAQETTSSMTGLILRPDGEPAAGVSVEITHTPSGTRSNTSVNAQGRFDAAGLRVGGPYTIRFSGTGIPTQVVEGVFIRLGEAEAIDLVLQGEQANAGAMEEIVVTGERLQQLAIGSGRQFNQEALQNAPTIARDLKDVVRLDPKIYIDPTNSDAIHIAGVNNRFNSLTVDGIRQNDDFGLNNNGYPTQRTPLSFDAIEAVTVQTAPFDVQYSGFQGGTINVVTKSGTNDFHGSAYYFYSSDDMTGDTVAGRKVSLDFEEKTYGGTLGGPIIQDKLFFFANYEKFDRKAPVLGGPAGGGFVNEVRGIPMATYQQIAQIAQSVYGYDVLAYPDNLPEEDEKYLAKIDWNITDSHRASFTYQRTKGNEVIQVNGNSTTRVSAPGNWYNSTKTLETYTAQLFSDWTDNFSTELKLGRKQVKNDRVGLGDPDFAEMEIQVSSSNSVILGTERFSQANVLTNDLDQIKAQARYLWGDHTLIAGYEREMLDVFNLFVDGSQGQIRFGSIEAFQNRQANRIFYRNAFTNDSNDGAAQFELVTDSLYVQDSWDVTPELTLQAGLRYERFSSDDTPAANANFLNRNGYANTETFDGKDLWMPRFGFNYQVSDRTTVRGGAGLFGGGTPNVWLSNSFSRDGITVVDQTITSGAVLSNIDPKTLPASLLTTHGTLRGNGEVNAVDPDFKIPSTWKYSAAVDHEFDLGALGDNYELTLEAQYSEIRHAPTWIDATLNQVATAPDGRPLYRRAAGQRTADFILTNSTQGDTLVLSADLNKSWETDFGRFDLATGYAYTNANDINAGTSSTADSNFARTAAFDANSPELATSNYEVKHRWSGAATWTKAFFGDYETKISLFAEHRSGKPYSVTFGNPSALFDCNNSSQYCDPAYGLSINRRQLFYVPADQNDVIIRNATFTWADLDNFIRNSPLEQYRGQIVPRNAFRAKDVTLVDLKVSQEIPGLMDGHKGEFEFVIKNFTNMLDNDWGRTQIVSFPHFGSVVNVSGIENGRYVYTGSLPTSYPPENASELASLWRIQVGVRYEF